MKPILSLLLLAVLTAGAGPKSRLAVRPDDTSVSFTITKWSIFKEEGRFRDVEGEIHFEPDAPERTTVRFSVAVASVDTGKRARDRTLQSEDFFHSAAHPTMHFESTRVVAQGADGLDVTGRLTIRGITKTITVPVQILGVAERNDRRFVGFESEFTLDRTDYGVLGARWSGGEAILGHQVTVRLLISASTATP